MFRQGGPHWPLQQRCWDLPGNASALPILTTVAQSPCIFEIENCSQGGFPACPSRPPGARLDLDATDDPLHGTQEGRFFHGYYDGYCYLPLYIFCGRHLLVAKLRRSDIDGSAGAVEEVERVVGQIRQQWPKVRIVLRADSGFARDGLMSWCEANGVEYVFGLARNARLQRALGAQLREARLEAQRSGEPARVFRDFRYRTRKTWSRRRRVIGKAEHLGEKANPRFIVTSLDPQQWPAKKLYEQRYCARGEMENRIKEAHQTGLGLYTLAYEISKMPVTNLVHPINRAVFPCFSRMAAEEGALSRGYLQVVSRIALIAVPAGFGIAAVAPWLVPLVLGEQWVDAIPTMRVLAVYGALAALASGFGPVFMTLGRPRVLTQFTLVNLALFIPAVVTGALNEGVAGAA